MEAYTRVTEETQRYPIGLTITDKGLHISAIGAKETCSLVLFQPDQDEPQLKIPMDPALREGDVWNLTVEGRWPKRTMYCLEAAVYRLGAVGRSGEYRTSDEKPSVPGGV